MYSYHVLNLTSTIFISYNIVYMIQHWLDRLVLRAAHTNTHLKIKQWRYNRNKCGFVIFGWMLWLTCLDISFDSTEKCLVQK